MATIQRNTVSEGLTGGLLTGATLVLFILKVTSFPGLSWWVVFAPLLVAVGVPLLILTAVGTFALVVLLILPAMDRRHHRQMLRRRNQMYKGKKP